MDTGRFFDRVAAMHATWVDRRQLREISAHHTLIAQFELLRQLHGWAAGAVDDVRVVFGTALSCELVPARHEDLDRSLTVVVDHAYALTFSLTGSADPGHSHWRVVATARVPGGRSDMPVRPHRQVGIWTRREFEDALLTLLSAYERDRSG